MGNYRICRGGADPASGRCMRCGNQIGSDGICQAWVEATERTYGYDPTPRTAASNARLAALEEVAEAAREVLQHYHRINDISYDADGALCDASDVLADALARLDGERQP